MTVKAECLCSLSSCSCHPAGRCDKHGRKMLFNSVCMYSRTWLSSGSSWQWQRVLVGSVGVARCGFWASRGKELFCTREWQFKNLCWMAISAGSAVWRVRGGYDNKSEGIVPVSQHVYHCLLLWLSDITQRSYASVTGHTLHWSQAQGCLCIMSFSLCQMICLWTRAGQKQNRQNRLLCDLCRSCSGPVNSFSRTVQQTSAGEAHRM